MVLKVHSQRSTVRCRISRCKYQDHSSTWWY